MRVEDSATIEAPRGRVWEMVADPSVYPRLLGERTRSFDSEDPDAEPGCRTC